MDRPGDVEQLAGQIEALRAQVEQERANRQKAQAERDDFRDRFKALAGPGTQAPMEEWREETRPYRLSELRPTSPEVPAVGTGEPSDESQVPWADPTTDPENDPHKGS